jgi:alpha/beta superfamily hydrolase
MQGTGLKGTKLRGTEIVKIEKQELETIILDVRKEQKDLYELVQIETSRGRVDCAYYRAEGTDKGVIMVTGVSGDFDSPADSLYPRLSADLKKTGISSLRIKFRNPKNLAEALIDILVGMEFLESENVRIFGLIEHSFGGAVVVRAAYNNLKVKTIVMLSTQGSGIDPISLLPKDTSVFLIHGEEDETISPDVSVLAYNLAHEPKRIEIYDSKAGHDLDEVSDEVYVEVKDWIIKYLKRPDVEL